MIKPEDIEIRSAKYKTLDNGACGVEVEWTTPDLTPNVKFNLYSLYYDSYQKIGESEMLFKWCKEVVYKNEFAMKSNQLKLEVANRSFIDKRRSHLIDIYTYVSPNTIERVATYSTKTHSLTFYNFPLNYTRLWESVELFKQLFPIILKRSDEK